MKAVVKETQHIEVQMVSAILTGRNSMHVNRSLTEYCIKRKTFILCYFGVIPTKYLLFNIRKLWPYFKQVFLIMTS